MNYQKYLKYIIGIVITLLVLLFLGSGLLYLGSGFYKDCNNLSSGITEEQFKTEMSKYINDDGFLLTEEKVQADIFGHEQALRLTTEKWFSVDPWMCTVFIDNGVVSTVHLDFD